MGGAPPKEGSGGILSASAAKIAGWIAERELSCVEIMQAHLARIKAVNGAINAVVALDPERAMREAAEADRRVARGERLGPLHGVPITVKDSFDTEGLVSTAGTTGRRGHVPMRDATAVRRLREAGAILIGKTNTPELTMGSGTENLIHGRTLNPYDLSLAPAGSSGGAAAIVAAGGAALELGSDTGGSIRNPAHVCGIAGLKPTAGRVPLTGHIVSFDFGFLDSLTQVGPLARRVEDLAIALSVIAGPDGIDPLVAPVAFEDFQSVPIAGLRVGWFVSNGRVSATPDVAAVTRAAAAALKDAGAAVVESIPPPFIEIEEVYARLRDADGASCIARLLERCGTTELTERVKARFARARPLDGPGVSALVERTQQLRSAMLQFMGAFDVLLCPPAPDAAQSYERLEKSTYEDWVFQTAFNVTGWPAVVVRAGATTEGLPVGVQIVAGPWREHVALAAARTIEERLGGYVPPRLSG